MTEQGAADGEQVRDSDLTPSGSGGSFRNLSNALAVEAFVALSQEPYQGDRKRARGHEQ